jgi:hypothetical protein
MKGRLAGSNALFRDIFSAASNGSGAGIYHGVSFRLPILSAVTKLIEEPTPSTYLAARALSFLLICLL